MQPTHNAVSGKPRKAGFAEKKLEKVHVLILDSSTQVTSLFKNMLEEIGFTKIFVGNNGAQGVQVLREIRINLIITDWELKIPSNISGNAGGEPIPFSGIDFVKRLRHSPSSPNPFISIIMLADPLDKAQAISARDSGVNEICIKPLSAQQLCEKIMAVIERPRIFITSSEYKGPCRRHSLQPRPAGQSERRSHEVRVVKFDETDREQVQ